ncbi:MAG: lipid biosynthesis B12-binding/radical SAM protein [Elusimicrobia bacterium]|nr:lipid biosynthesis B12-binding/radical SAM protein [Elusimicrobiota bacterium]
MISPNLTLSPYPVYPLGMGMIAAALQDAGHEVRQLDLLQLGPGLDAVAREVRRFKPGLVGLSVRNIDNVNLLNEQHYIRNIRAVVAKVREATDARVLLGGAGFSLMPELILREVGADYGIVGEGEALAVEFARNAQAGTFPAEPIIRSDGWIPGGRIGPALYDESLLPFYLSRGRIASVQTKRGCASRCVYCTYPLLEGARLRAREPRSVVDDIVRLRDRHQAKHIFFVDSVFNDDEKTYLAVVAEMERRGVCMPWTGFFKPGGLDDETVARMKRTGFAAAEIGADAACDTTLLRLGKDFTFREVRECNDLLARHGVAAAHYFMFGGPGETPETVREGIRNVLGLKDCVAVIFMGIRILPDTPLARLAVKEGVIAPGQGLLDPAYYVSPGVDREWLERALTEAFAGVRRCVFPPDSLDGHVMAFHKMGYTGPLWEMLLPRRSLRRRRP